MAELLARWNEAETWDELLSLNAESIRQSRECEEEQDVVVVPLYFGPREDCIGAADEYIQPLLDLHKYGILSTSGSPGFNRFRETVVDHGTIFWHSRAVPYIEFIIRDKGKETARSINRLLQDERFTMNVLDGFTGKPCFGTEN